MFLNKHIVRCPGLTEKGCIESVEDNFETKRARIGSQTKGEMGVFFDPEGYMEYEREEEGSSLCKFKTGASKLDCSIQKNNKWDCKKKAGKYIAYHDTNKEGHYEYHRDIKIN